MGQMKNELERIVSRFAGKTPDQIAEILKKRSIRGRMGTTSRCPMALLFAGEATGSYVIGRKYIVRRSGKSIEKVRTPLNVATLVRKFDIGQYPELIAPPLLVAALRVAEATDGFYNDRVRTNEMQSALSIYRAARAASESR